MLAVALAILVTLVAAVLLLAFVDRNLPAIGALCLLAWMSGDATLRQRRARRRLGLAGGAILAVWALGVLAAVTARVAGIF